MVSVKALGRAKKCPWPATVHPDWVFGQLTISLAGLGHLAGPLHPVCADCGLCLEGMGEALSPLLGAQGHRVKERHFFPALLGTQRHQLEHCTLDGQLFNVRQTSRGWADTG